MKGFGMVYSSLVWRIWGGGMIGMREPVEAGRREPENDDDDDDEDSDDSGSLLRRFRR